MNTMQTIEIAAKYEAARRAAYLAEAMNLSTRTQNKKWSVVYKYEDELKTRGVF